MNQVIENSLEAILEDKKNNILVPKTIAELEQECPNMFVNTPYEGVSDKYTVINVFKDVVVPLQQEGWFVRVAKPRKSKKFGEKATFMLRLYNNRLANSERCPELIIISSHNGRSSLKFRMGLIEFMCENGLIVMNDEVEALKKIRITHKGDITEKLAQVIQIIENETYKVNQLVKSMKMTILTKEQQRELALKALEVRGIRKSYKFYDEQMAINTALQSPTVYDATIVGQDGDSLFDVFQRIQGNIAKGMVFYGRKPDYVKNTENMRKELLKLDAILRQNDNPLTQLVCPVENLDKSLTKELKKSMTQMKKFYGTDKKGNRLDYRKKMTEIKGLDATTKFNEDVFSLACEFVN